MHDTDHQHHTPINIALTLTPADAIAARTWAAVRVLLSDHPAGHRAAQVASDLLDTAHGRGTTAVRLTLDVDPAGTIRITALDDWAASYTDATSTHSPTTAARLADRLGQDVGPQGRLTWAELDPIL